jgi:hypothetical protein
MDQRRFAAIAHISVLSPGGNDLTGGVALPMFAAAQ